MLFEIAEEGGDVLIVVDAAAADRSFGMHVDALQEDGLSVEENAGAINADVAEANVVGEFVLLLAELMRVYFVELGRFGRPEGELAGLYGEGGAAVGVRL